MTYLEHGRGIVVDSVDTRAILPEEHGTTEEEAPHNTLVGAGSLEGLPETNTNSRALLLESLVNSTDLLNHIDVIFLQLAHPAEVLNGLFAATTSEQPTRRLLDENASDDQQASGDQLDREGNQPLLVARGHCGTDTVLSQHVSRSYVIREGGHIH